jgi:hypothetical protein
MFEASWSKEGGMTSFWTLFVVTLLALTWAQGQRLGGLVSGPILNDQAGGPI